MPHTNSSVLTIGVYLADVDDSMAPMAVVPGSHKGELFALYNEKEQWVELEPGPVMVPPDPTARIGGIFAAQQYS